MPGQDRILLDSGTNEVEILELVVGGQSFGINVLKIQQILTYDPDGISWLAGTGPSILGTFLFREEAILLIDLGHHLFDEHCPEAEMPRIVVVCEINNRRYGFLLERISQIFRISWDALQAPSLPGDEVTASAITGVISIDETDIMMLNLEDIIEELIGHAGGGGEVASVDDEVASRRAEARVMLVDDSHTVRDQLSRLLGEAGYGNVRVYSNGQEAYDALAEIKAGAAGRLEDGLDALVTDIEMPLMDGLTLCRRLKEETEGLPVVILSSMVTEQIADKCREVGADAYLSKQDLGVVAGKLDEVCGMEVGVAAG